MGIAQKDQTPGAKKGRKNFTAVAINHEKNAAKIHSPLRTLRTIKRKN